LVLVVEDEPLLRAFITDWLAEAGLQ